MKTRSYSKELTITEPATRELLREALVSYTPESVKDFIITCLSHSTALKALERGWLNEPGTYLITDIWFDKSIKWHQVRCQVRKIS